MAGEALPMVVGWVGGVGGEWWVGWAISGRCMSRRAGFRQGVRLAGLLHCGK